ncbi:MAG: hypothetical protein QF909_08155 [SAR202 cluster bacterium]|nr:hypothetical protein [SAR202 cluster bacterium]
MAGGSDGHVSNPLSADTDGDGIADPDDGAPLDAGTSEPPDTATEPVIAIDRAEIALSADQPTQTIAVSNAGDGDLRWNAFTIDSAIVTLDPAAPDVFDGTTLTIQAASSYDFSAGPAQATVWVIDAVGAVNDIRSIRVTLQPNP